MLNHIGLLVKDLRHIFSKKRGIKKPFWIFLTHLRLKFKQKFFELFRRKVMRERFLGMEVEFPDYGWFCHLWREIFILENYFFESENPKPSIIDVGSNIGMSVLYFKFLYPDAQITAFEPDPRTFGWLEKNISLNKLKNVTALNVAAGAKEGKMTFYQDTSIEGSGINGFKMNIVAGIEPGRMRAIDVVCKKLSSFMNSPINLLKIDVEGAEYEILEEIKYKLGNVKRIFLEVHQAAGALNDPIPELLENLSVAGFRYAVTANFLSHRAFISDPLQPYALMVDAERFPQSR
jgi:FkbM family methyltransferase